MLARYPALTAALLAPSLFAFDIRSYNATDHDRFTGTIGAPARNPNQLFAHLDLTGVGWQSNGQDLEYALVSRQHVVFATHFVGNLGGNQIRFLNSSDQIVSRTGPTVVTIMDGGNPTDLSLVTLGSPINAGLGVEPLPYYDLTPGNNLVIGVVGQGPTTNGIQVIGSDTLDDVEASARTLDYDPTDGVWNLTSRFMRFDYRLLVGGADEGIFEIGDSGSPTFVETNGRAALIGTHSYFESPGGIGPATHKNYDVFVPHYITQLDAAMAPLGYRMRPANAPATTLSGATSAVEATPRRLHPLTLEFDLGNTGGNLTGNLEVEFQFPAGQEPDSVSATGWVTYGSGTKWTLRKATLAAAGAETLSASWAEAPAVAALTPTLVWRSDTVADQSDSPVIALAPSYAEWALGLAEPGEQDDPDDDQLVNLLEYAFGGDAESGVLRNANGDPLLPRIDSDGTTVTLVFPERDDAGDRGLTYTVWFSDGLSGWTNTPPAGTTTGTAPHVPAIPGFVERSVMWPASAAERFARILVTLDE